MHGSLSLAALSLVSPRTLAAQNRHDVIVIGAGLSGLNAALILQDAGLNVQVIEGRKRVGGRVLSARNIPGNPELGGTYLGGGYARCIDAASRYGVDLIDGTPRMHFANQRELMLRGEHIARSAWPEHRLNPFSDSMRGKLPWEFFPAMASGKNPLQSPEDWQNLRHAASDISVYEFLKNLGASDAAIDLGFSTNTAYGTSAYDVSMLMMFFLESFGKTQQMAAVNNVVRYTAKGGNQSIPEAMANALQNEVHFSRTVTGIRSESDGAEVHCADGTIYKAGYVICSVPFPVLKYIKMDPGLQGLQAEAVQTLRSQPMNQVHMVASEPFWEDDGMAPEMFTDGPIGQIDAEHKHPTDADAITSLTAFVNGRNAVQLDLLPRGEAGKLVLRTMEKLRPASKGKLEVAAYKSWTLDPYCGGDWAYWQPGQITRFGDDTYQPNGRIHFCGEHTAVVNRGMEGAMESGERAALEIFSRI